MTFSEVYVYIYMCIIFKYHARPEELSVFLVYVLNGEALPAPPAKAVRAMGHVDGRIRFRDNSLNPGASEVILAPALLRRHRDPLNVRGGVRSGQNEFVGRIRWVYHRTRFITISASFFFFKKKKVQRMS